MLHPAHVVPVPTAHRPTRHGGSRTGWWSAWWWPSSHHVCLCICAPVSSRFFPQASTPGGAHQQLMRGWLLREPVPPGNGGEEQRWREQRGPCTRHTEEDTQLIPIDVLLGREQQPASALGWEGRNGSQEGREQASR